MVGAVVYAIHGDDFDGLPSTLATLIRPRPREVVQRLSFETGYYSRCWKSAARTSATKPASTWPTWLTSRRRKPFCSLRSGFLQPGDRRQADFHALDGPAPAGTSRRSPPSSFGRSTAARACRTTWHRSWTGRPGRCAHPHSRCRRTRVAGPAVGRRITARHIPSLPFPPHAGPSPPGAGLVHFHRTIPCSPISSRPYRTSSTSLEPASMP